MAQPETNKPYTFEDLSNAMKNYNEAMGRYKDSLALVKTNREAMESHERTASEIKTHVDRYKAEIRRITDNLEK